MEQQIHFCATDDGVRIVDLKDLRRDLDIQSEIRRSAAPGTSLGGSTSADQQVAPTISELALSDQATSLTEPLPTRSDAHVSEGSIRYRIVALVAMLLLAIVTLGVWYYFHEN